MAGSLSLVLIAMFGIYLVAGQNRGKLRDRIDYLEIRVNRETAQTRDNIYELRNLVWSLNASQDTNTDGDVGNACSQDVTDMEQKLELFTASQETSMRKLAKGFNTEKILFRKSTVAQEKITTRNLELINETKTALEEKVAQIEAESNETMKVLGREIGEIKATLTDIQAESNETMAVLGREMRGIKATHTDIQVENKETMAVLGSVMREIKATLADIQAENESLKWTIIKRHLECPSGWLSWETSCYLKMTKPENWTSARQKCSYMGAHLAQAESEAEMRYLLPLLDGNTWLGGNDFAIEGTWQWAEGGAIITYLPWASGQPNSYEGNQDCLETHSRQSGKLNDDGCFADNAYVCEKQAN